MVLSQSDFVGYLAQPTARAHGVLTLVLGIGLLDGISGGFDTRALILTFGSIVAAIGLNVFRRQLVLDAARGLKPSWAASGRTLAAWAPTLMSYYLTFYDGAWKGFGLLSEFSFLSLAARLLSIYLGYRLIVWLEILSDIPGLLQSGALVVTTD